MVVSFPTTTRLQNLRLDSKYKHDAKNVTTSREEKQLLSLTRILSCSNHLPMKYGKVWPKNVPTIMMINPIPYPKIIPESHIDGPEGRIMTGSRARERTRTNDSNGLLNVEASQTSIGINTCRETSMQVCLICHVLTFTAREHVFHQPI